MNSLNEILSNWLITSSGIIFFPIQNGIYEENENIFINPAELQNYANHLFNSTVGGFQKVPEEVSDYRLSICQKCDFFNKDGNRCRKCGCSTAGSSVLTNKLLSPHQQCPDNPPRWLAVTENNPSGIRYD